MPNMPHICSATFEAPWQVSQPVFADGNAETQKETPSECGSLLFQNGFTAAAAQAALMCAFFSPTLQINKHN
jgi:hypothetical protein